MELGVIFLSKIRNGLISEIRGVRDHFKWLEILGFNPEPLPLDDGRLCISTPVEGFIEQGNFEKPGVDLDSKIGREAFVNAVKLGFVLSFNTFVKVPIVRRLRDGTFIQSDVGNGPILRGWKLIIALGKLPAHRMFNCCEELKLSCLMMKRLYEVNSELYEEDEVEFHMPFVD